MFDLSTNRRELTGSRFATVVVILTIVQVLLGVAQVVGSFK
jgi:heme A synthase